MITAATLSRTGMARVRREGPHRKRPRTMSSCPLQPSSPRDQRSAKPLTRLFGVHSSVPDVCGNISTVSTECQGCPVTKGHWHRIALTVHSVSTGANDATVAHTSLRKLCIKYPPSCARLAVICLDARIESFARRVRALQRHSLSRRHGAILLAVSPVAMEELHSATPQAGRSRTDIAQLISRTSALVCERHA